MMQATFVSKEYVSAGISSLMSNSDGLGPFFVSKDGKSAVCEEGNVWKFVYIPPELAFLPCSINVRVLFRISYLDLTFKQLCFPAKEKV